MNFEDWFSKLQTRTARTPGAGLVAFRSLLSRLGNPQNSCPIVHVAGTNGKGTVCTLLAHTLTQAGKRTGLFISPHLVSPTERIQLNGAEILPVDFRRVVEKVLTQEREPLNFFEVLTAAAFVYFAEQKAEYGVLETGLGGRKDPTNVCNPVLSIITSVGLDHTQILGDTLEQISTEKSGILKPGVPVLCGYLPAAAAQVIKETAREKKAPLEIVGTERPLGNAQAQNGCLVRRAAKLLGISSDIFPRVFETAYLPGRFEVLRLGGKTIILDGAHNPPAMENLVAHFRQTPFAKRRTTVLCGFMQDKDYPKMLALLSAHFQTGFVTAVPSPRSAGEKQLKPLLRPGWEFVPQLSVAWARAQEEADVIVCTGSFYLVGAVLKNIKGTLAGTSSSHAF